MFNLHIWGFIWILTTLCTIAIHPFLLSVCIWEGGQQAAWCSHRQGSAWLACSLFLCHLPSLSRVLPSLRRVQQGELHCNAEARQENLQPYCSTFLFPFNAIKKQLLYKRKAAWSAEPGFALLGVCEARLCSRRACSGCICMCSGCPCLGRSWCKLRLSPRLPDVCPVVMDKACRDKQNGTTKGGAYKTSITAQLPPV